MFEGRRVSDAALAQAAEGLAARVLAGGFIALRLSRVMGWFDVAMAIGFGGTGVVLLVASRRIEGLVLGILGLINCGLFMFAGVSRALWTRQIRRNAAQA